MSGYDPLAAAARAASRDPALFDDGRWITWGELSEQVDRWAETLERVGAVPGQRVALVTPPSAEGIRALFAVLRTGAVVVPLHPALTAAELAPALAHLRPAVVLAGESQEVRLQEAMPAGAGALLALFGPGGPRPAVVPDGPTPRRADLPGVAAVWTSGTSGAPRAVLLTGEGLEASARGSAERLGLQRADRWLTSLALAHVGGLALVTRAASLGSALVPMPRFGAEEFLDRVRELAITHAALVPTHLHRVIEALGEDRAPASLRAVLLGGAAAPPPLVRAAAVRGIPVAVTYGLTEATSQVATATPEESDDDPGCPGRPLSGVEIAVDEAGGIRVRGAIVAAGLVQPAPEGRLVVEPVADADGWLDTGDLGHVDEHGRLHLTGRRSDRIITGGVNVDPVEVERVLLAHPSVVEAAVVGVPDEEWGERVVAAVVLKASGPFPAEDAVAAYLRDRLTGAKRPKELRAVEAVPRNANGKVDRAAVRALFEASAPR